MATLIRSTLHRLIPNLLCAAVLVGILDCQRASGERISITDFYSFSGYTFLPLPDGKIFYGSGFFDPVTETWTQANSMIVGRTQYQMTALADGRILVTGGHSGPTTHSLAEVYDPTNGSWSPVGMSLTPRGDHLSVLLPNGRVLIVGGYAYLNMEYNRRETNMACEEFDPIQNKFEQTSPLDFSCSASTASLVILTNGRVFLSSVYGSAIYEYQTRTWTRVSWSTSDGNTYSNAVATPNGKVVVMNQSSTDIYDTNLNKWRSANKPQMQSNTRLHLILLADGSVFAGSGKAYQLFDSNTETWSPVIYAVGDVNFTQAYTPRTLLPDGRILFVDHNNNNGCAILGPETPLSIVEQPKSIAVKQGDPAELRVLARGTDLGYVWRKNGTAVVYGGRRLSISNVQEQDYGVYDVTVVSKEGILTSQSVTLSPPPVAPVIARGPVDAYSATGEAVAFDVTLSGATSGTSFRWYRNGIELPDASGARLTLPSVRAADAGVYTCVATNSAGSATSGPATLTVLQGQLYSQEQYDSGIGLAFEMGKTTGIESVVKNPNAHQLYQKSQLQALRIGTPLLAKDPVSGKFKLTLRAQTSRDLVSFAPLPFSGSSLRVTPDGSVEHEFESAGDAAFFQVLGN